MSGLVKDNIFGSSGSIIEAAGGLSWQPVVTASTVTVSAAKGYFINTTSNTGIGIGALDTLTSGNNNTAIGKNAGTAFTSAARNTAIGTNALTTSSTNGDNTAVGRQSLKSCTGDGNTALGKDAGEGITSGVNNIAIGRNSADNLSTGSGNVIIGADIDAAANNSARTLKIAGNDGSTTTTWISGDSSANVVIGGTVTEYGGASLTTTGKALVMGF